MKWIQNLNIIPHNSITITLLLLLSATLIISLSVLSCKNKQSLTFEDPDANIIFLHHSTGNNVWIGGSDPKAPRVVQSSDAPPDAGGWGATVVVLTKTSPRHPASSEGA